MLTAFQFQYLFRLVHTGLANVTSIDGNGVAPAGVDGIVFAVTSSNHHGTRRNPLTFADRAQIIHEFGRDLSVPVYAFAVEDVGYREDFAAYTVKTVNHRADNLFELTTDNTLVACSTPVGKLYSRLGYQVFGAEAVHPANELAVQPWDLIEAIASSDDWHADPWILDRIHPGAYRFLRTYRLGRHIRTVLNDPIVGEDGDLTETRDYGSYVRQMDENAGMKWQEVAASVQSGRIGDIGCAVGSWLRAASYDSRLQDSDLYGIEVTRALFQVCEQRKDNNEFGTPNIWFAQKNAVTGLVFMPDSMDTIHTGSLTHEVESYGSHEDLLAFIENRFRELKRGGVWINRDVVGPPDRDRPVLLWAENGSGEGSARNLFLRFAADFRRAEGYELPYDERRIDGETWFALRAEDAAEFMLTKDYTDNWQSEMHERFCYWSYADWTAALTEVGFRIRPESRAYTNPWIVENRWQGSVRWTDEHGNPLPWPPTNMVVVAAK